MGWEGNDRTDRNERRDLWWAECQGVTSKSVLVGEKNIRGALGGAPSARGSCEKLRAVVSAREVEREGEGATNEGGWFWMLEEESA